MAMSRHDVVQILVVVGRLCGTLSENDYQRSHAIYKESTWPAEVFASFIDNG